MLVVAGMLVGCSGGTQPQPLTWREFPPKPAGEPVLDAQGYIKKDVGEAAGITDESGVVLAQWMVQAITVDAPCTAPAAKPAVNGHFVRVDLQAELLPSVREQSDTADGGDVLFLRSWSATDRAGLLVTADAVTPESVDCLEVSQQLPTVLRSGQRAVGSIILDVPITAGSVSVRVGRLGWTFELPEP